MFTIRLESVSHYDMYSCDHYSVVTGGGTESGLFHEIRAYRSHGDMNPLYFQVGEKQTYTVAYITNMQGKTVDTIRFDRVECVA